jgi:hypothetical protein
VSLVPLPCSLTWGSLLTKLVTQVPVRELSLGQESVTTPWFCFRGFLPPLLSLHAPLVPSPSLAASHLRQQWVTSLLSHSWAGPAVFHCTGFSLQNDPSQSQLFSLIAGLTPSPRLASEPETPLIYLPGSVPNVAKSGCMSTSLSSGEDPRRWDGLH